MRPLCKFYTALRFSREDVDRAYFFSDRYIISFFFLKAGMCVPQFDCDQQKSG